VHITRICSPLLALLFAIPAGNREEALDIVQQIEFGKIESSFSCARSPDDRFLYVLRSIISDNDVVDIYSILPGGGQVRLRGSFLLTVELSIPKIAITHGGLHIYAIADKDVYVMDRDPATGALDNLRSATGGNTGGLNASTFVLVSNDDRNVYVAGRNYEGFEGRVYVYERAIPGGGLTFIEYASLEPNSEPEFVLEMAMSRNDKTLYVPSFSKHRLWVWRRAPANGGPDHGELTLLEVHDDDSVGGTADGLRGAYGVSISPDDRTLLVAGQDDNAIAVFSKQPSGRLTFHRAIFDDEPNLEGDQSSEATGLEGARHVRFLNHRAVLVGSYRDQSASIFKFRSNLGTFEELDVDQWSKISFEFLTVTSGGELAFAVFSSLNDTTPGALMVLLPRPGTNAFQGMLPH